MVAIIIPGRYGPVVAGGTASGGSEATVTYDNSFFSGASGGSVTTYSQAFAVGAGVTSGALVGVVCFVGASPGSNTSPSMTYNAVSMTLIDSITGFTAGDIYIFGLTTGQGLVTGNHLLAASWTGNGQATLGALSVDSANQTGGATTFLSVTKANGSSATASTGSITSPANRICFAAFTSGGAGFSTAGNTDIGHDNGGNFYNSAANRDVNNANPTLTYALTSNAWNAIGCSIKGI